MVIQLLARHFFLLLSWWCISKSHFRNRRQFNFQFDRLCNAIYLEFVLSLLHLCLSFARSFHWNAVSHTQTIRLCMFVVVSCVCSIHLFTVPISFFNVFVCCLLLPPVLLTKLLHCSTHIFQESFSHKYTLSSFIGWKTLAKNFICQTSKKFFSISWFWMLIRCSSLCLDNLLESFSIYQLNFQVFCWFVQTVWWFCALVFSIIIFLPPELIQWHFTRQLFDESFEVNVHGSSFLFFFFQCRHVILFWSSNTISKILRYTLRGEKKPHFIAVNTENSREK